MRMVELTIRSAFTECSVELLRSVKQIRFFVKYRFHFFLRCQV